MRRLKLIIKYFPNFELLKLKISDKIRHLLKTLESIFPKFSKHSNQSPAPNLMRALDMSTHAPCSFSFNLTPRISRVLIGWHFIFSSACCNSPRKCTPGEAKSYVSNCHIHNLHHWQGLAIDLFLNSESFHNCIPHFSSESLS